LGVAGVIDVLHSSGYWNPLLDFILFGHMSIKIRRLSYFATENFRKWSMCKKNIFLVSSKNAAHCSCRCPAERWIDEHSTASSKAWYKVQK
jgi:hypothetical protein